MFEQRAQIPVETRDYSKYYLLFSGILFVATVWSVWDEVKTRRPWKDYQDQYHALLVAKLDSLRAEALSEIDNDELTRLQSELAAAHEAMKSDEYRNAVALKESLLRDLNIATREWRFARSRSDAAYYEYQKAQKEGRDASRQKAELDKHDASIEKYFLEMQRLEGEIATLDETINRYADEANRLEAEIAGLYAPVAALELKLERTRRAPIEIRQVMLNDFEFTPFQEIKARIDRCQTCHVGWSEPLMEEAPQPFTLHPLPELLAKHNPETFGCTPCHQGQGPALTAGFAHGDDDHYWETPLLRGVDVYASCNTCHSNESVLKFAKPFTQAKQLLIENGCYGCHGVKGYDDMPKIGPPLNTLTNKTTPDWIFRWVKEPHDYNPHTRMPSFEFSDEDAEAVTAYLVSIARDAQPVRTTGPSSGGSVAAGKRLFETVGCVSCHVVGENTTVREQRGTSYDIAPELTRVGSKVNADWLFGWLKNPRSHNPEARMPSLRLTDDETRHLVAYLMSLKDDRAFARMPLDLAKAETIARGDKIIREVGCAGCHTIAGMEREGKVSVDLSDFGRKKVEQMDFGDTRELPHGSGVEYRENPDGTVSVEHTWAGWVYGKMKNARLYKTDRIDQRMPVFRFSEDEIKLLRMFLRSMTKDVPLPAYQQAFDKRQQDIEMGRRLSMRYNCVQCHAIEDRGGYVVSLYEEEAMGPPKLTESQGAKVQEPWLHSFLKSPTTIRPWLDIRMPTFPLTDDEVSIVTKYFLGLSHQELKLRDYAATPIDQQYLAPGRRLFETYQCANCHPSGPVRAGELSAAELAPNLTMASSRLKPEWILDWLDDPQKLQPGTRMPSYFYEGQGPDVEVFDGKASEQIKALKTYVWSLGRRQQAAMAR